MQRTVTTTLLLLCWLLLPPIVWGQEDNTLLMPTSTWDNNEHKVGDTPLILYDSGGADGNAQANKGGKIVFTPEQAGKCIEIEIQELALANQDELYILEGYVDYSPYRTPNERAIIRKFTKVDRPTLPLKLRSSGKSGQITIGSKTKANPGAGFKIIVRTVDQPAIKVASILEDKSASHDPYIGEQSLIVSNLKITTEGLAKAPKLTALHYKLSNTKPSDITAIYLYEVNRRKPKQLDASKLLGKTTEVSAEGTITLSKEYTLSEPNYDLVLVVDLKSDVAAGSRIDVATTKLTTTLGDHEVTLQEPKTLTVEDAYALAKTPKTYTVGDKSLTLYDDGGKYEPISEKFDGYAVFKPETAGKVIQVDFTKLDLFSYSSISRADLVEVYNGSEVNADNLIIKLNKEKAYKATSTAPDGSLTIRLVTNTGTPKDGFEALVSQIDPAPMAVDSLSGRTIEVDTFAMPINASVKQIGMVAFTLVAQGTKDPVTLQRLDLSSTSKTTDVAQVALYYSPIVDDFTKAKEIARWDFAEALTATLPTPQALREGANHFYLAVDLQETAHKGNKVNLSIDKLHLSAGEKTLPEKERTRTEALEVMNKMVLTLGKHHIKVYEPWNFMPQPNHYRTSSYDTDAGERSVTFEATAPDNVIQLDINEWGFYYSSWGSKPTLKIYDGKDATAPLLFELKPDREAFKTKPADYLRSTQKYLTFVFDARGGEGYIGWRGQIKQYLPQDMKVDSAAAKQLELPFIAVGSEQNPVLALNIHTIGDRKPILMDGLTVDLKGGAPQIERVALYAATAEGTLDTNKLIAAAQVEPTMQSVDLPTDALKQNGTLKEFANNYILAIDIRKDAPAADSIDVAIAKLTVAGKLIDVRNADPKGSYKLVNIFNHPSSGDNKEVTVTTPLSYYDEGGPDGKVLKNTGSYVTFLPAHEGEVVTLTIDSIALRSATFGIYSGRDHTVKSKLLSTGDNNILKQTGVRTFTSQEQDGSLTVYYKSSNEYAYGWAARVESVKPRDLFVEKVTATALPADKQGVLSGSSLPAVRIDLTTAGERGKTTLEKLQLEISSEGIEELALYATGAINEFDEAHLIATSKPQATQTEVIFKLDPADTLTLARTQYYWVKAQLAGDLKAGTPISVTAKSVTVGGTKHEVKQEKPFDTKTRQGGLQGTLRVGSSSAASYKSLAAAAKDLTKQGVSGAVTVEVEPGEYPETVLLERVPGASAKNSITIVGLGNSRDEVVISANGYNKPTGPNAYREYYGVMTVRNTPYVTLRNMTIHSTDLGFPTMVYVQENSSHFTMDNCHVYTKNTSNSNYNMSPSLVKVEGASNPHAQSCDVLVENSLFEGGHIALQIGGTTTVANPVGKGYTVRNNRFVDHSGKAIYVTRASEVLIEGNEMVQQIAPQRDYSGIDATFHTDAKIIGNDFDITQPKAYKLSNLVGINVREVQGEGLLVANNVIRITRGSATSRAFTASKVTGLNFVFNTAIARDGKCTALLMLNGDISSSQLSDNILQNRDGGGILFSNQALPNEQLTCDRNALYTSDSKGVLITAKGKKYDATNYQEATKSTASKVVEVAFVSDKVLYPKDMTVLPQGAPHAAVTMDLIGTARDKEHPTVGAYEHDPNVTDEAPKLTNKQVVRALHQSATISVEPDQMTDVYLMTIVKGEEATTAPDAATIREKGRHFTALGKRTTEFTIMGLEPETTYEVYGLLHGTLNNKDAEPELLFTFTTTYMPTRVATFEKDNRTIEGDVVYSGTNSFAGVKVVEDFTRSRNQIAEMAGDKVTITVTNSKGKIPQRGFSLMADRSVYMRIDGGTRITLPATEQEWAYVDLAQRGDIREVTLESRGKLWIDDYNGDALAMQLAIAPVSINLGQQAQLTAEVIRGVAPYSYKWSQGDSLQTVSVAPTQTTRYSVTVTDAAGSQVTESVYVYVNGLHGEAMVATFEEQPLSSEEPYNQKAPFGSGSFAFSNSYNAEWKSWSGFALAASADTTYTGDFATQQYNNVVGGGQEQEGKSKQYVVAYCPGDNPKWGTYNPVVTVMPGSDRKVQLEGVYLTNTAWVKSFATQGDKNFGSPAFKEGSFFIVTITADNGKKVEVPLIDYRNKKREVVNDWKWVDLSSLGEVKTLKFSIQSSDTNAPSYFAMDNLHIKQDASAKPAKEQIALEVMATTETTAQVRWQALPTQVSYTVSYRPIGADASATQTMRLDPTQQLRSLELRDGYVYTTLEGLQMGTRYEVTVEATIMPALQTVAQGKTTFTTQAIDGKLDAKLVAGSLQAQSFAISFATIAKAESYMVELAKVDKEGNTTAVDIISIAADGSPLGELSPLQAPPTLQDGRITLPFVDLSEQTAYRVTVTARQGETRLCSEQLIIVTPQATAIDGIDGETARVVATPEGILVMGLQGATIELYTASGAQVGRYQITEPEQLIAEQLQSGIYIVAAHKAGEVRTFRLIL
ncbi:DUF4465 domain-containing protein [Porphyromonas uenonis]|uniref:DUF4465 domain-containing protein n=2 Tax=Porphyromonas uenonis TaxID=281920 RepID=UPI000481E403|nr:DUF4465 domain-containing protein [Porphyromonas uenonis]